MTSHYRHRRFFDPAIGIPPPLEPGEIAVNTSTRQIAVGDADPASPGSVKQLLGVRRFDVKAQYAAGEFVTQLGGLYRSNTTVSPGAFNSAQWDGYANDTVTKTYIDQQDNAIIADYEAADDTLTSSLDGKVEKTGDTMTGPLTIAALPVNAGHVANKQYVDERIAAGGIVTLPALSITYAPGGAVSSTNVQAAIAELDSEKASIYSPAFQGVPTTPNPPAPDNSLQIPNTAWVNNYISTYVTSYMQNYVDSSLNAIIGTAMPKPIGTVAVGTATRYSREDHVHPSDPTRAPIASPAFTGNPTAPTPPPGDNDKSIATTEFVQAAFAAAPTIATPWSTGDVKLTFKTVADIGWVLFNDGTMGDASSGGTARANADTADLFALLWTNIPNIYCPVSGGRGADAASDFAAHKTIKLAAALGRSLGISGNGAGLTARALGQTTGVETVALDPTTVPASSVTLNVGQGQRVFGGGVPGVQYDPGSGGTGQLSASTDMSPTYQQITSVNLPVSGGGGPHNNMQPTLFMNAMVKL